MATRQSRKLEDEEMNMTPMIDVVFLLIIFFMLVSTFASAEQVRMSLPEPDKSQDESVKIVDRVLINGRIGPVSPISGERTVLYSVGPNRPQGLDRIAGWLRNAKRGNPQVKVIIRADKRLRYEQVREVMEVVAETGIEQMSLVAHVSTEGD